jgi:hypothetical protein
VTRVANRILIGKLTPIYRLALASDQFVVSPFGTAGAKNASKSLLPSDLACGLVFGLHGESVLPYLLRSMFGAKSAQTTAQAARTDKIPFPTVLFTPHNARGCRVFADELALQTVAVWR